MGAPVVLLAAGGTGGHLFPAEALAHALIARGVAIELATDERAAGYAGAFPARAVHAIPAATPSGRGVLDKIRAGFTLLRGVMRARPLIGNLKPVCVVGFGGYPTVPPLIAASQLGVATILHEQNAVLGRANRFLARRVTRIATGFGRVNGVDGRLAGKLVHVGNPVRPAVIAAARAYEPAPPDGGFRLLVFGGSQGARVMADVVPAAIGLLTPHERARLFVVQQARGEDEERVRAAYAAQGANAEVRPFFADLPAQMAEAHLVVARAGASTVAELAVIGRPAILVPLPGSLDQDQAANAGVLAEAGGAIRLPQTDFTPARLAAELSARLADPDSLSPMAAAAQAAGAPDAAERLADLVLGVAGLAKGKDSV